MKNLPIPKGFLNNRICKEDMNFEMPKREGLTGPKPQLRRYHMANLLRLTNLSLKDIAKIVGVSRGTLWNLEPKNRPVVEENENRFVEEYISSLLEKTRQVVDVGYADFSMFGDAEGYSDALAVKLVDRLFSVRVEPELQSPFLLVMIQAVEHILDKKREAFSDELCKAFEVEVIKLRSNVIDAVFQLKDSPERQAAVRMLKAPHFAYA